MGTPEDQGGSAATGVVRLVILYSVMAAVVVAIAIVAISKGEDKQAEASIAGGYDTANPCLGEMFDVKQSGQFVNFSSASGDLSAKLRLEDGQLTGTVNCVDDSSAEIDAKAGGGKIAGTLGDGPVAAVLKRDPPPAGTPPPRVPTAIDGEYSVSPRSLCLGSSLEIDGGSNVDLTAGDAVGTGTYDSDGGALTGKITCPDGVKKTITGLAADRTISLTVLDPGAVSYTHLTLPTILRV